MARIDWAGITNEEHIERIFTSINTNKDCWNPIIHLEHSPVHESAWILAHEIIDTNRVDSARLDALIRYSLEGGNLNKHRDIWYSVQDALIILIAYPESSYFFDVPVEEVKLLAELGDNRALLLLPACIAFSKEKSK